MVNFNQTFYVKGGSNNIYATKFTKILCKFHLDDGQLNVQYYCKFAPEPNKEHHIGIMNELYFYYDATMSSNILFRSTINCKPDNIGDHNLIYDSVMSVIREIELKNPNMSAVKYGWDDENLCVKRTKIQYTYDLISKIKFIDPRTLKWLDEQYPYLCEQDAIDNNKPKVIEFEEDKPDSISYSVNDMPQILDMMKSYVEGCLDDENEYSVDYFQELVKSGLFLDAVGKVINNNGKDIVEVVEEY